MIKHLSLFILIVFSFLPESNSLAQIPDSSAKVVFSGYVDVYYATYSDSVGTNNFQQFASIDPRSNTFGLNTALITAQYDAEKVRGIITLHYGDIAKSLWPQNLNNIMEANVNIRLIKKLWLGAGFFRTHFGTEGLLPKENFTSSISIGTVYEPSLESGIRLKYEASEKFVASLYVLNGYNIFEENNEKKSIGLLAVYTIRENCNIGYSNYLGDDSPTGDSITHFRIHQNLFFNYQYKSLKLQAGGDYCIQENSNLTDSKKSGSMYSGLLSLKTQATEKFALYIRGEIFNDPEGCMSGIVVNNKGLQINGITLGIEQKPTDNSYVRLEGRSLFADENQKIFHDNNEDSNQRTEILFNVGVSF